MGRRISTEDTAHHLNHEPAILQEYLNHAETILAIARNDKYWLRWAGHCKKAYFQVVHAAVQDITIPVSVLVFNLSEAYFIQTQGHESNPTRPSTELAHLLAKSTRPDLATWMDRLLKSLLASGLAGYDQHNPLYILTGKQSRKFGVEQGSSWALAGAVGLENVKVSHDILMEEVKRVFLAALIEKYQ
ncbi:hypothetical protein ASPWEDRAFT_183697 [Aspergillus wentii DTO 134E9]|uniref:Uncharacterized protein n=1 Tax=Aspergillus wentii DTO 134E9 TaxID=1073089 RepID=A0A1L9RL46_ASPWE|nr:uncharacterized protein ASPWEDRAFT_183697 [Aspergillus wentii DTO 134E9]OJJ35659.1 hypothetical protein ASPWEDRAFT_183697 [Aspergillus wentii DTO 134E9]